MKNLLLTIAAVALLLLTSCQRDELQGGSISGEEVTVSISAVMPGDGGAVVKSKDNPGNGSEVNRCILEVYLLEGEDGSVTASLYGTRHIVKMQDQKASFEDLNLITGQKYRFVLWADYVDNPDTEAGLAADKFYETDDAAYGLQTVTMVTESYAGNEDKRDAFFYRSDNAVTVDGPADYTLQLKRPFGQLNIITTDYGLIPDTHKDLLPAKVQLAYKSIPTGINLLTGELLSSDGSITTQKVTGAAVDIANLSVSGNSDARQLSFDYILAPAEGQTVVSEFTMSFLKDDGTTPVAKDYTFESIPVQRNYRTNVSGALLTDRAGVDVKVVPNFNEPALVYDTEEFYNVMEKGGYVALAEDITITDDAPVVIDGGVDVIINLAGHTITRSGEDNGQNGVWAFRVDNGTLTLEDSEGTGEIDGGSGLEHVTLWANGSNSKIVIKGGNYTVGGNSTGNNYNTCVYASNGGQVEIYGGTFGNEVPQTGSQDLYPALNLQNGSPGTITVYGGTFINYDPAKGDDSLGGTFVADGHSSIQVSYDPAPNGTFEVVENGRQVSVPVEINTVESFKSALSNDAIAAISVEADMDLSTATTAELTFTRHKTIDIASGTTIKLGDQNHFEAKAGLTLTGEGTIDNTTNTHDEMDPGAQKSLIHITGGDLVIDGVTLVNDKNYHLHGDASKGYPYNSAAIAYWNDANVTITNAHIESGEFTVCGMGRGVASGVITITDSYFESTSSNIHNGKNWSYAMRLFGSKIRLDNCVVKGTQGGVSIEGCQDAVISSGKYYTVNTDGYKDAFYPVYLTNGAVVTITGGEFYSPNDCSTDQAIGGTSSVVSGDNDTGLPSGSVILKGGKFSGKAYNHTTKAVYEPAEGYMYKEITGDETFRYEVVPE